MSNLNGFALSHPPALPGLTNLIIRSFVTGLKTEALRFQKNLNQNKQKRFLFDFLCAETERILFVLFFFRKSCH